MSTKRDYYEILGVSREAAPDEINKAFRKLALEYHPDRNGGDPEAVERFKEVNEANEVLSDSQKRQLYNRGGHEAVRNGSPARGAGAGSIFDFVQDMFGQGQSHGPRGGSDVQVVVDVTLEESYRGVKKSISYPREENCPDCSGNGIKPTAKPPSCRRCNGTGTETVRNLIFVQQTNCRACRGLGVVVNDGDLCTGCRGKCRVAKQRQRTIDVPPGVDTRDAMSVQGGGHHGEPGGEDGDLVCVFRVAPHKIFERHGAHLSLKDPVPLTFGEAALGASIEVPTLDGPLQHDIEPGMQAGSRLRFDKRGMPDVNNPKRRGDLIVPIAVQTPRNLTPRQRELLVELAEIEQKQVSPERKGFFDKIKDYFRGDEKKE